MRRDRQHNQAERPQPTGKPLQQGCAASRWLKLQCKTVALHLIRPKQQCKQCVNPCCKPQGLASASHPGNFQCKRRKWQLPLSCMLPSTNCIHLPSGNPGEPHRSSFYHQSNLTAVGFDLAVKLCRGWRLTGGQCLPRLFDQGSRLPQSMFWLTLAAWLTSPDLTTPTWLPVCRL